MASTIRNLLLLLLATTVGFSAGARELDRERTITTEQVQAGRDLPKTLVVRVKNGTRRAEVLHLSQVLKPEALNRRLMSTSSFYRLDKKGKMIRELDRDSSSSSWWFVYPNYYYGYRYYSSPYYYPATYYPSYYYPTYNYWGYNYVYRPYYWYNWGGYSYAYYGWPYYNRYCYY